MLDTAQFPLLKGNNGLIVHLIPGTLNTFHT